MTEGYGRMSGLTEEVIRVGLHCEMLEKVSETPKIRKGCETL